jgi:hypothetical protein
MIFRFFRPKTSTILTATMVHRSPGKLYTTIFVTLLSLPTHCLKLWPNPGSLPSLIPAPCRAALTVDIVCPNLISSSEIANDVPINTAFLDTYCAASCKSSLQVRRNPSTSLHHLTSLIDLGGQRQHSMRKHHLQLQQCHEAIWKRCGSAVVVGAKRCMHH